MRQLLVLLALIAVLGWAHHQGSPARVPLYRALELRPLVAERLVAELRLLGVSCSDQLEVASGEAARARWLLAEKSLPSPIQVERGEAELCLRELAATLPPDAHAVFTRHPGFEPFTLFCDDEARAAVAAHLVQLYLGGPVRMLREDGRDVVARRDLFARLEKKTQDQLDAVLGPGRAAVQVIGSGTYSHCPHPEHGVVHRAADGREYVTGCCLHWEEPQFILTQLSVELWLRPAVKRHREKLTALVKACIGADEQRGDKIWIEEFP